MEKLFWVDLSRNVEKTYHDLVVDLNNKKSIRRYIYFNNPYEIFVELIHSMVIGYEVVLLDFGMTIKEIANLGINYDEVDIEKDAGNLNLGSIGEVYNEISNNINNWRLTMYTSGTTGKPKIVTHRIETLTRNTLIDKKFENNIWAFGYNPTHFAGLQVFFQAFMNRNTMVNVFDLERNHIPKAFEVYKITNISATPTFYRNIIPYFSEQNYHVNRVTLGGEKFDSSIAVSLKSIFPNAKIKNIYASTEFGSLFTSNGEIFRINDDLKSKVRISEEGELLIHADLLGQTPGIEIEDNWYKTGDIVELVEEDVLKFRSRKTEMINVGGYKVNPHEIEEEIMKVTGVVDVLVKPRKSSVIGNILEAEVVVGRGTNTDDIEIAIHKHLKDNLQKWKIPQIVRFVDDIEKTRTGKKVRI